MIKHKHHIVPRHAGGSDDPTNIVELTIEEHAEAHRLLYEQHNRPEDKLAWQCLSGMLSKKEIIKEICSIAGKKGGAKGGKAGKGRTQTEEWIKKRSQFGEQNGMYGKHHTDEAKKQKSDSVKSHIQNIGALEWQGTKNLKENATKRSLKSKGVTYRKNLNKWVAQVSVNYKKVYLGCFTDKEEAEKVVMEYKRKHFGVEE